MVKIHFQVPQSSPLPGGGGSTITETCGQRLDKSVSVLFLIVDTILNNGDDDINQLMMMR